MKYLVLALLSVSFVACGDDDTKKAASNNVVSNNANNTTNNANNTATNNANNTATNNANNTATNNAGNNLNNVTVTTLDLGEDTAAVSTLTAAEVCSKGAAHFAANVTESQVNAFSCFISGYFSASFADPAPMTDAALQEACQMGYDACLAEEPTPNNSMESCDFVTTGCEAEIRVLEACLEGNTAMLKLAATTLSCEDVTLESDPLSELDAQPLECEQLEMECPDFFVEAG